ncbi:hypothetical protein G3I13_01935 [Streptomyces sp. SID6673]|nr:hypothetical protein [Streptomyces sp. SID11726]NDZ94922.1 hypothetical protein [Streptomyces sp. SID11726]NEB23081.1 hypothetical protein [Streptomyces sp. SID6673]
MGKKHKRTYHVVRHWSIREGDWYYAVYRHTDWGDCVTVYRMATGDEAWAFKNAERLGVEVEDEADIDGEF